MKSKVIAVPYIVWALIFIVVPTIFVGYFAFTDVNGAFTLENVKEISYAWGKIRTLSEDDFLIHLCCHLYKEATTVDWLLHRRDLMLYKFSDINVVLHNFANYNFITKLIKKIKKYNTEQACYYVFKNSSIIYPDLLNLPGYTELLDKIEPNSKTYLKQIVFPKEKKILSYSVDFEQWFNSPNRLDLLNNI